MWVEAQRPGSDTSIDAFLRWREQQRAALAPARFSAMVGQAGGGRGLAGTGTTPGLDLRTLNQILRAPSLLTQLPLGARGSAIPRGTA